MHWPNEQICMGHANGVHHALTLCISPKKSTHCNIWIFELKKWMYDSVWFYVNCIGQGLLYSFRIDYLNSFEALVFSASLWLSIVYFPNWNVHLVHNIASLFHFICIYIFLFYFNSLSLVLCLSLCVFFFSFSSHNVSTVFEIREWFSQ